MDEPKGIVYVDIPVDCDLEVDVANEILNALGWSPDQFIDSNKGKQQFPSNTKTNRFTATSVWQALQIFSHFATKYKQEYKKMPVLIINNVNRLAQKQPRLLDQFQDYAKSAADNGLVTTVFISSEGRVPRRMMRKSIMLTVLFVR
jgi:hypothetical protein